MGAHIPIPNRRNWRVQMTSAAGGFPRAAGRRVLKPMPDGMAEPTEKAAGRLDEPGSLRSPTWEAQ
jgi:hypothetical protein